LIGGSLRPLSSLGTFAGATALGADLNRHFIVAGFATGGAVPKAVFAKANVQLALAKHAILLALATFFDLLALAAANFDFGGGHEGTLPLLR